jgi:hypothetical protein
MVGTRSSDEPLTPFINNINRINRKRHNSNTSKTNEPDTNEEVNMAGERAIVFTDEERARFALFE